MKTNRRNRAKCIVFKAHLEVMHSQCVLLQVRSSSPRAKKGQGQRIVYKAYLKGHESTAHGSADDKPKKQGQIKGRQGPP